MSDVKVTPGENAVFEVHVPDQPVLDWYKEGVLIEDEGRFVIEDAIEGDQLYRLTVEKCEPSDCGTYTCLIKNDYGETECSALLTMSKPRFKEGVDKPLSTTSGKAVFEPEEAPNQKPKGKFGKQFKPTPKEVIEKPSKATPLSIAPEKAQFEPKNKPDCKTKKFSKDESTPPTVRAKPSSYDGKDFVVSSTPPQKKSPVDIPPGKRKVLEQFDGLASKPKFLTEIKGGRVSNKC